VYAGCQHGAIPVASIEDHALVQDDLKTKRVRLDVGNEFVELDALHQRKEVGGWVKLGLGDSH